MTLDLLEMFVPESDPSDPLYFSEVRACDRINKIHELAFCLDKKYGQILDQARCLMRPVDHPRGRQYLGSAVNELYASYKINAPHIFTWAKQPFLSNILGQVRTLADASCSEGGAV